MHDATPTAEDFSERFFRELADNAPVMIWRSRPDKQCDWFNKPWLDFVGRTMEQELGDGWAENVHRDDFDRCLRTYVESFDARRPFSMTYRLRRHDGEYRYILDNGAPFTRGGEFAGYFGSGIDVTEQMTLEARLRQAQKREAVARAASGVAHDLNNVLQIIGTNLEMLSAHVAGDLEAEALLGEASQGLARGSNLASQLVTFGRAQETGRQVVNIGDLFGIQDKLRRAIGDPLDRV